MRVFDNRKIASPQPQPAPEQAPCVHRSIEAPITRDPPKFLTRKVGRLTRRPTISLSVSAYTQPTCTTRFCASASDAVAGCAGN